jgi:hypothetical protein
VAAATDGRPIVEAVTLPPRLPRARHRDARQRGAVTAENRPRRLGRVPRPSGGADVLAH